ncbi:MAG: ATP-binding cassette domain-containing protein, partial [Campylobacterota bacterium]
FALLQGVSGSGKSTLLALIAGFEKPSSGAVYIADDPISKLPDLHQSRLRNAHIGFVFQAYELFEDLTVYDNVFTPTVVYPGSYAQGQKRIAEAMQSAGIDHKAKELVKNLSGGEKQRCAIARALVNDPEIIICDEPTANLDHANSLVLLQLLQRLKNRGKTILVATHDPLFGKCDAVDSIFAMDSGRLKR